jgi:hypothetical protein
MAGQYAYLFIFCLWYEHNLEQIPELFVLDQQEALWTAQ